MVIKQSYIDDPYNPEVASSFNQSIWKDLLQYREYWLTRRNPYEAFAEVQKFPDKSELNFFCLYILPRNLIFFSEQDKSSAASISAKGYLTLVGKCWCAILKVWQLLTTPASSIGVDKFPGPTENRRGVPVQRSYSLVWVQVPSFEDCLVIVMVSWDGMCIG